MSDGCRTRGKMKKVFGCGRSESVFLYACKLRGNMKRETEREGEERERERERERLVGWSRHGSAASAVSRARSSAYVCEFTAQSSVPRTWALS